MDPKKRNPQHRPRREEARSHEVHTLRGENNSLKKQVARLRKQLGKAVPPEEVPEPVTEARPVPQGCPKCRSADVRSAKLPTGTLSVCQACSARWKAL